MILDKYEIQREKFNHLMNNQEVIEEELQKGSEKAKIIAKKVINRIRNNIGY